MTRNRHYIRSATFADAPAIARVHVDSWRSTYRGIVPDSVLDTLGYDARAEVWRREIEDTTSSKFVLVADTPNNQIAGFVSAGPERTGEYPDFTGEIYAIYVADDWHGYGVGRAMMSQAAQNLLKQGHKTMLIWALTENPACAFYRYLGGIPIARQTITAGHKTLEETAFGWENIAVLVGVSDNQER